MKSVLVAMSGGVDSSAAAYILQRQGYNVAGITMVFSVMMPDGSVEVIGENAAEDASRVCRTLGVKHHVIDLREDFNREVVSPFVDSYLSCLTPNPCVFCNRTIKFGRLFDEAKRLGYSKFATGHYADIAVIGEKYFLKRNVDEKKDQTYFLYVIEKEKLRDVIFPLGHLHKDEVRDIARSIGLHVADKGDSQDICFLKGTDYREFVQRWMRAAGRTFSSGKIVTADGKILGTHDGLFNFTIGQRKGLGIGYGYPLYVTGFDVKNNLVVVGPKDDLFSGSLVADNVNLFDDIPSSGLIVRTRYSQRAVPCSAVIIDGKLYVKFTQMMDAVTPGQSAVLYKDDIVVGGGVIVEVKK